jgi:Recombination endonuclease VII
MTTLNERRKQRYKNDPEYRESILASNRASHERHRDAINAQQRLKYAIDPQCRDERICASRARYASHKDEINAAKRDRYATDPEYREKERACNRACRERHKDEHNARRRLRYATDPDFRARLLQRPRAPINYRERYLKENYGISLEQYQLMLKWQGGRCAICRKKPKGVLCVDHCHKTGRIRGLLCRQCNSALGQFRDSRRLTMAATAFLGPASRYNKPPWWPKPVRPKSSGRRSTVTK